MSVRDGTQQQAATAAAEAAAVPAVSTRSSSPFVPFAFPQMGIARRWRRCRRAEHRSSALPSWSCAALPVAQRIGSQRFEGRTQSAALRSQLAAGIVPVGSPSSLRTPCLCVHLHMRSSLSLTCCAMVCCAHGVSADCFCQPNAGSRSLLPLCMTLPPPLLIQTQVRTATEETSRGQEHGTTTVRRTSA